MTLAHLFWQSDALLRGVWLLLLAMSVSSWVFILYKWWLLHRASTDVARSIAAFWQSDNLADALQKIASFDRENLVMPMVLVTKPDTGNTLSSAAGHSMQLTRVLRCALRQALVKLQHGQVLLASVGATAPFVGLLGTVWGIYHALMNIASASHVTIDKLAGPVGESLIMTAAGLVVAIPAVLAYNILGRMAGHIEADLEGFAHDLHGLLINPASDDSPQVNP